MTWCTRKRRIVPANDGWNLPTSNSTNKRSDSFFNLTRKKHRQFEKLLTKSCCFFKPIDKKVERICKFLWKIIPFWGHCGQKSPQLTTKTPFKDFLEPPGNGNKVHAKTVLCQSFTVNLDFITVMNINNGNNKTHFKDFSEPPGNGNKVHAKAVLCQSFKENEDFRLSPNIREKSNENTGHSEDWKFLEQNFLCTKTPFKDFSEPPGNGNKVHVKAVLCQSFTENIDYILIINNDNNSNENTGRSEDWRFLEQNFLCTKTPFKYFSEPPGH